MIAANELRIGNWVNVPHGNVCIEKFVNNGVHFTDQCGGTFSSLEPIPLTPEILESCDCSMEDENVYFKNFDLEWVREDLMHIRSWTNIRYLHQLQNFYFALTGEELEINL